MKVVIGPTTNDFKLLDDEGVEMTDKLCIRRVAFDLGPGAATTLFLECYVNGVEITTAPGGKLVVGGAQTPTDFERTQLVEIRASHHNT